MARPWACLRHTTRLKHAHMGSTTCVVCTPWPQRHRACCSLPPPRAGTRALKPCAVSQLMKPWAQCHGLMASSDSWLAPRWLRTAQGRNALCTKRDQPWAQCHGSLLGSWEASNKPKPWAPRHGTGSHINVGNAHWCTRCLVRWLVHAAWIREAWSKTCWWAPGYKRHLAGEGLAC